MTSPAPPSAVPVLVAAAAAVVAESLALLAVGVSVIGSGARSRLLMDLSTTAFFLVAAAGLLVCAWGLWRARRWARGPVVFAQLIGFGVAWNLYSGELQLPGVVLALVALAVLGCVLSPPATRALLGDEIG